MTMTLRKLAPFMIACMAVAFGCNEEEKSTEPMKCSAETQVVCNNTCIDPMTDANYCGAGDNCVGAIRCKNGQKCWKGNCVDVTSCPNAGDVQCGIDCINPKTSTDYCGADANCLNYDICGVNQSCVEGKCQEKSTPKTCTTPGEVMCGTSCIDPKSSDIFCGADENCLNYESCKDGKHCDAGECKGEEEENSCIVMGEVKCGESCINPYKSNEFCGAVGKCENYTNCTNSGQECVKGECMTCFPFTDDGLKTYALETWDTDKNGCTTDAEIQAVTEIVKEAFRYNTDIHSLADLQKFQNLVTIGNSAFLHASEISGKVVLPKVTSIGMGAFWYAGIQEIEIPEVTEAGLGVFANAENLTRVLAPKLTDLKSSFFKECKNLHEVSLPAVVSLGNIVFNGAGVTKLSLTAAGEMTIDEKTWEGFSTENCDLTLNSDKQAGGSGSPLADGNNWAGATWKSISYQ